MKLEQAITDIRPPEGMAWAYQHQHHIGVIYVYAGGGRYKTKHRLGGYRSIGKEKIKAEPLYKPIVEAKDVDYDNPPEHIMMPGLDRWGDSGALKRAQVAVEITSGNPDTWIWNGYRKGTSYKFYVAHETIPGIMSRKI